MGKIAKPTVALLIGPEDTRQLAGLLFENSDFRVSEVDGCDAALKYLSTHGLEVGVCFAELTSCPDGDCASFAKEIAREYPWVKLVISKPAHEAASLPANASMIEHPWAPIDLIIQAERAALDQRRARLSSH
jgi:hypothetical protein